MSTVGIYGVDSELGDNFVGRLLQADRNLVVEEHLVNTLRERHADTLRYGKASINPLLKTEKKKLKHLVCFSKTGDFVPGTTLLIHPSGVECTTNEVTGVAIHDLLLSSVDEFWSTNEIIVMLGKIAKGEQKFSMENNTRYWIHPRDVTEALSIIIDYEESLPSRLNICARRAWSNEQIWHELCLLWRRTQNSLQHKLDIKDLEPISPIPIGLKTNSIRPDLSELHQVLYKVNGLGWHPIVPMRVALMECIAAFIEKTQ